jgi:hypothetical protein
MLRSEILSAIDVKADLLDADKAPSDPVTAAVKSIQKATGLDESAAKALLDQRSSSAEMTKGD